MSNENLKGKLNPKVMLALTITAVVLMLVIAIVRFAVAWPAIDLTDGNGGGISGTATGLFVFMFMWLCFFCVLIILGEIGKCESLTAKWPMLTSRMGRGWLIILWTNSMFYGHWADVLFGIFALIIGGINVMLGWNDTVTVQMHIIDDKETNQKGARDIELPDI